MVKGRGSRNNRAGYVSLVIDDETPDSLQEPGDTVDTSCAPGFHRFQRTHEHFIEPHGVRTELVDHLIGIDHVAARLRHLLIIFPQYNALVHQFHKRFRRADHTDIE